MDDLISRQAAIDALQKEINKGIPPFDDVMGSIRCGVRLARNIIEDLPSAQPYTDAEIQKIQELEEAQLEKAYELGYQAGCAAQPEHKRGKWIIKDNPGTGWYRVTCSECGEDVTSTAPCIGFYPNAKVTWDYCPNCGADMREVSE